MEPRLGIFAGLALSLVCWSSLEGQNEVWGAAGEADFSEFRIANVVPHGQPLIPVFEGWYPNPDGTKTASWGYFNMNTEETFHVPIGPDNFVEPAEFDGLQPTYFMSAPSERGRRRRHESVFAITVPGDFRGQVVWTIRARGLTVKSPSSFGSDAYEMLNLESATSSPVAPLVRVGDSPAKRGRVGPRAGPVTVSVGESLLLDIWLDLLGRERSLVSWYHHQGPGEVTFARREFEVEGHEVELQTQATFSEPGDYMLRVTALENRASLVQHCCWTNGYLEVTVTP
jgi:hypothetical protein